MSVYLPSTIGRNARRRARRLVQRLRALRNDGENPYSPAASLVLLLAVGIAVKFH